MDNACEFKQCLYAGACKDTAGSKAAALWYAYNFRAHEDSATNAVQHFVQA